MTHDPTFWFIARATGLTAYVLVTASVLAGLVLKSRVFGRALKPATVTDLHRFLAVLSIGAVLLHGLALVLDSTVHISVAALILPGLSPYRPLPVAVGVIAAELMVLVYASFSVRRRIGAQNWRRLHWATYAIFAAATAHGVLAGTDTTWARPLYVGSVGAVAAATAWRALARPAVRPHPEQKGA